MLKRIQGLAAAVILAASALALFSVPAAADQASWQYVPGGSGPPTGGYVQQINGQDYWFATESDPASGQSVVADIKLYLGRVFGYWTTSTNGDQVFIQVDPASGNPVKAVDYGRPAAGAQSFQQSYTEIQTSTGKVTVKPPVAGRATYPGGGGGSGYDFQTGPYSGVATTTTPSDDSYNNFVAFWYQNPNPFPVQADMTGSDGSNAPASVTETLPANSAYYLYAPLSPGGASAHRPYTSATVDSIRYNGKTYPVTGPKVVGFYQSYDPFSVQVQQTAQQTITNDPGPPAVPPGGSYTVAWTTQTTQTYNTYENFVPTLGPDLGNLQPAQSRIPVTKTTRTAQYTIIPPPPQPTYSSPSYSGGGGWSGGGSSSSSNSVASTTAAAAASISSSVANAVNNSTVGGSIGSGTAGYAGNAPAGTMASAIGNVISNNATAGSAASQSNVNNSMIGGSLNVGGGTPSYSGSTDNGTMAGDLGAVINNNSSSSGSGGSDYSGGWSDAGASSGDSGSSGGGSGGTVICTELRRQGLLNDATWAADQRYGNAMEVQHPYVMKGYHFLAAPVVAEMRASKGFTRAVYFFAAPWAREMAFEEGAAPAGSLAGRTIMLVGAPICGLVGVLISLPGYVPYGMVSMLLAVMFLRMRKRTPARA